MEEATPVSHLDLIDCWIKSHHLEGYVVVVYMEHANDNLRAVLRKHVDDCDIIDADICICCFSHDVNAAFDFIDNTLNETTMGCYATLWKGGVVIHENT